MDCMENDGTGCLSTICNVRGMIPGRTNCVLPSGADPGSEYSSEEAMPCRRSGIDSVFPNPFDGRIYSTSGAVQTRCDSESSMDISSAWCMRTWKSIPWNRWDRSTGSSGVPWGGSTLPPEKDNSNSATYGYSQGIDKKNGNFKRISLCTPCSELIREQTYRSI